MQQQQKMQQMQRDSEMQKIENDLARISAGKNGLFSGCAASIAVPSSVPSLVDRILGGHSVGDDDDDEEDL